MTRGGWRVIPEKEMRDGNRANKIEVKEWTKGKESLDEHVVNFLDAIRKGSKVNCTVEMGKEVAMVAHLGNIAHRTGEKLIWDDVAGKFTNSEQANALLAPEYSDPWKLPQI